MSDETKQTRARCRRLPMYMAGFASVFAALGGTSAFARIMQLEEVGPAAAEMMLSVYGDPCDGVLHPAYQTDARARIVDGVQASLGADTNVPWLVEKVAEKDGWAYIEAASPEGPESGEYVAYILRRDDDVWEVRWTGPPGAQAGQSTGDPYPRGFDSSDQDILRCQTGCSVGD